MSRSLPVAETILEELSNRKLSQEQENTISKILKKKTSPFALIPGRQQAFGDKYQSLEQYKTKRQQRQQRQLRQLRQLRQQRQI